MGTKDFAAARSQRSAAATAVRDLVATPEAPVPVAQPAPAPVKAASQPSAAMEEPKRIHVSLMPSTISRAEDAKYLLRRAGSPTSLSSIVEAAIGEFLALDTDAQATMLRRYGGALRRKP